MEGLRNIFWCGDQIVWNNLFRHYVYCLHLTNVLSRFIGDTEAIKPHHIPIMSEIGDSWDTSSRKLLSDICDAIFSRAQLLDFTSKLATSNRKVRRNELLLYLRSFHAISLYEIENMYAVHGLSTRKPTPLSTKIDFSSMHDLLKALSLAREKQHDFDPFFTTTSLLVEENLLLQKRTPTSEKSIVAESNRQFIIYDFPRNYIERLEGLLYPDWYAACFFRSCNNSSIWANYGDHHRGACLIFATDDHSGEDTITLKRITGYSNKGPNWHFSPLKFYDVTYSAERDEIDFFRSLGQLPQKKAMEVWYTNADGTVSECGSYIHQNIDTWRGEYWTHYYPSIAAKTCDWEYEQESRLILYSLIGGLTEPEHRKLKYKFNSLRGIVFGIRASDSSKLKIINMIREKCRKENRPDFAFYQAYYNPQTGDIGTHKMSISLLN